LRVSTRWDYNIDAHRGGGERGRRGHLMYHLKRLSKIVT
jgi:hypothetical protein